VWVDKAFIDRRLGWIIRTNGYSAPGSIRLFAFCNAAGTQGVDSSTRNHDPIDAG